MLLPPPNVLFVCFSFSTPTLVAPPCSCHTVTRGFRTYFSFLSTHRYCLGCPDICFPKNHSRTSVRPFWEGAVDAETNSEFRASKPRHGHVTFLLDLCCMAFLALAVFATVLRETRV